MDYYRLKLTKSKLKAISTTSSLMAGFAMVAMVEMSLDYESFIESLEKSNKSNQKLNESYGLEIFNNFSNETDQLVNPNIDESSADKYLVPRPALILYVVVTCLLVGVHMLALMISTCILPQVEATTEQMEFERDLKKFEEKQLKKEVDDPTKRTKSKTLMDTENATATLFNSEVSSYPHSQFHNFVELAWISSTVVGIFLFIVEIGLICFIKFYPISFIASLTGIFVMIPVLLVFIYFIIVFYKKVADYKLYVTKQFYNHIDRNLAIDVDIV